jgi:hypothetical protein
MELANDIRYYHFISGVLSRQKADPFCGRCKAFANTVAAVREALKTFEIAHSGEIAALSQELRDLFAEAKRSLAELNPPADAIGQKKAGNCTLPQGVCFVKLSKAIIEKII